MDIDSLSYYEKKVLMQREAEKAKFMDLVVNKEKNEIDNKYEQMITEKRSKEIQNKVTVGLFAGPIEYKGMKREGNGLLLGYDHESNPVWGHATNYIVAGTTGCGKSKKMQALLLNYIATKQGLVYICDLKRIDYKHFKGCKNVAMYIDDLEHVAEAVKAFQDEFNRRVKIFNDGYTDKKGIHREYMDMEDYNTRNKDKMHEFMLFVDEYADISDTFQDRNKRPIGVYADIIQLARTCRAVGGRIVLGTQRPSCDVIIGTLKNNCEIVGMMCLNSNNSRIMIDTDGCEELNKREALVYKDNNLTKVFSYTLTNEMIMDMTDKLK